MLYPSMFTFQRDASQVLEKDVSWVVKLARVWEKNYIHFKAEEKEFIYNFKFSKVDALRKVRSGAYSQEESCVKFSQAEGNVSPFLPLDKC